MKRFSWFIVALGWVLGVGASASAQCVEGRVQTAEGFCCWPSQTFDTTRRACSGPPTCPAGRAAEGETCVATQPEFRAAPPAFAPNGAQPYPYGQGVPPGQPSYPYGASAPPQYGSPPGYGAQPGWPSNDWTNRGAPQPRSTRGRDALLITGGVILAVSYLAAGLLGTFTLSSWSYPTNLATWVPIAPYLGMINKSSWDSVGWAIVIPTGISQLAGLIMLIAGAAMRTGPATPPRPGFSLLPGAPDAPAGVTLEYVFL